MDANGHEFTGILADEVYEIVGCAFEVHNTHGHGLNENIYENSLVIEFRLRAIPYNQQKRFTVLYKDEPVGDYIPDPIAHNQIVIDAKTIDRITDLQVGLILNFKNPRLEWERNILSAQVN